MTIDTQMNYIWQKHRERHAERERQKGNKESFNNRLDNKPNIGLGNGYTTDMRQALQKVAEYDYVPTEDEIHYRRFTTGQWVDKPAEK